MTLTRSSFCLSNSSKVLFTIYSNLEEIYDKKCTTNSYDFEHIIPKKILNLEYKKNTIPAGNLGNLMFLNSNKNRKKKDRDLYSDMDEGQSYKKTFLDKLEYPSKNKINEIQYDVNQKNFDSLIRFIEHRAKNILDNIIKNMYKEY